MASAARRTLALLSLLGAAGALRPCARATRLSVTRPSHRRSVESLTDAFANFVKQSKPKKPEEGVDLGRVEREWASFVPCLFSDAKTAASWDKNKMSASTGAVHAVLETNGLCEPARGRADHPAELLGDDHAGTSSETPLRPDAFVLSDEEKIAAIEPQFGQVPCSPQSREPRQAPRVFLGELAGT